MIKLLEGFSPQPAMGDLVGILENPNLIKQRIKMIKHTHSHMGKQWMGPILLALLGCLTLTDAQQTTSTESAASPPSQPRLLTMHKVDYPKEMWFFGGQILADGSKLVGYRHLRQEPMVLDLAEGKARHYKQTLADIVISPDGKSAAGYWGRPIFETQGILAINLTSGEEKKIYECSDKDTSIRTFEWSPDGEAILATLTPKGGLNRLVWVPLAGGPVRDLLTMEAKRGVTSAEVSPDGKCIAVEYYVEDDWERRDISMLSVEGGEFRPAVTHSSSDRLLGWLPSGDAIVFATARRGDWSVYARRIENGEVRSEARLLKQGIGNFKRSLGMTRDGTLNYVIDAMSIDLYVAELDPDTGKVADPPVRAGRVEGRNHHPAWSPDGRFLAFIEIRDPFPRDGTLCIEDWDTRSVREVVSDGSEFAFPYWHSNQEHLVALSMDKGKGFGSNIHVYTGKSDPLFKDPDVVMNAWQESALSADGKWFFNQKGSVQIAKYELASEKKEDVWVPWNLYSSSISPDGKWVAYSVTNTLNGDSMRQIMVVKLSGGKPKELVRLMGQEAIADFEGSPDNGLGWTPDSEFVLFVKGSERDEHMRSLWRVPAKGGKAKGLGIEMEKLRQPTISPDGRRIAFTSGDTEDEVWALEGLASAALGK